MNRHLPHSNAAADERDLLLHVLNQLDAAFSAVGIKVQQLADGHAVFLNGQMRERGLQATDVYGRAIRIAVAAAHADGQRGDVAPSFVPPSASQRTWTDSCRRDAAYGRLAEHEFDGDLLGADAWEFPSATTMSVIAHVRPHAGAAPIAKRFTVHFASATSDEIARIDTTDEEIASDDVAAPVERMRA